MKLFLAALITLSACQFTGPSVPEIAEEGTYKMITGGGGQCTAWVVDKQYAISAGHCCDDDGDYYLYQPGKKFFPVTVVKYVDNDPIGADPVDVCLLRSPREFPSPLTLAAEMPKEGDTVGFVGYPAGQWAHNRGEYLGDVDGPYANWNNYVSTAPCNRGASGSALYHDGGVYGVLVRLMVVGDQVLPGEMGCVASPLDQIKDILLFAK